MKKLTKQDITDVLYGCTVLGTGGGGSLEVGLAMLMQDFEDGKEFVLADLSEIPDDEYIGTPYVCGAISPLTEEEEKKYAGLPKHKETVSLMAFRALQEYFGKEFYGVISTELGGGNTADAFHVAAQLGKVIVDADPSGRSVPELQHTTYYINDVPITPIAVASQFGDTAIINNVVNDFRAEALVRAMAVVSSNKIGVTDHPITGANLKKCVIKGAISYALEIGKALREAKENNTDVAENIVKIGKGKMLFKGVVTSFSWDTIDGFTVGEAELDGCVGYEGSIYKVWFKNENIISWRDGEVDITVPDLICMVDKDGAPVTNPNYTNGMEISVFALAAPKEWKTPRGIEVLGPKSFGFDVEYVPFEIV